jgi:hypothetical protein
MNFNWAVFVFPVAETPFLRCGFVAIYEIASELEFFASKARPPETEHGTDERPSVAPAVIIYNKIQ